MKRTPGASGRRFDAAEAASEAFSWRPETCLGGSAGLFSSAKAEEGGVRVSVRWSPVSTEHILRTRAERQRIARETRLGRECQVRKTVPVKRAMRLVVIMRIGGRVRRIQRGVTRRMRIRRVVRAGFVVAEVAVRWVERKSVSSRRGSRRTLQRDVKTLRVSTISSKVFWCFVFVTSESTFLCPFLVLFCFSPVHPVEDNGLYRREYMPNIKPITTTTGPAYLITTSPYKTNAQNAATSKKLSHGSPDVHVNSPASLLSGNRKGCEYANALVICGGVAINRGDFWCTRIVLRCLFADVACESVTGENAAVVGGLGSLSSPSSSLREEDGVELIIQGVSNAAIKPASLRGKQKQVLVTRLSV